MRKPASVALAMYCDGHVAPAALIGFLQLVYRSTLAGALDTVLLGEGGIVDAARNAIVSEVLRNDAAFTHLMWVDPGSVVPPDALLRLVADGKEAVGGIHPRRLDRSATAAYDLGPFRWRAEPAGELQLVGGLGLGCTLVATDVYRRVQARHQDEAWHQCFYGRSEDVFFFERCRELGVEVWLDPSVRCTAAATGAPRSVSVTCREFDADLPATASGSVAPRVAIAVPLFELVPPAAMANLVSVVRQAAAAGLLSGLFFTDGMFYDVARNQIVGDVLDSAADITHIFWIDSDMVVPPGALERLLEVDKPVVGGLYHNKRDLSPAAFDLEPLRTSVPELGGLVQVGGFGLGCALVRRSVYVEMETELGDRRWHQLTHGAGEEVFFFERCRDLGISAWLDTSVRCGHLRDQAVGTADWQALSVASPPYRV